MLCSFVLASKMKHCNQDGVALKYIYNKVFQIEWIEVRICSDTLFDPFRRM